MYDDGSGPAIYTINHINQSGQQMHGVKRWRNGIWEIVGEAILPPNSIPRAYADLHIFDDGTGRGPGLYVSGDFRNINGIAVNHIARYDSSGWSAVDRGYLGAHRLGSLTTVRGPSLIVSQYVGCPSCYANCTNSTMQPVLTIDDFLCFINEFAWAHTLPPPRPRRLLRQLRRIDGSPRAHRQRLPVLHQRLRPGVSVVIRPIFRPPGDIESWLCALATCLLEQASTAPLRCPVPME